MCVVNTGIVIKKVPVRIHIPNNLEELYTDTRELTNDTPKQLNIIQFSLNELNIIQFSLIELNIIQFSLNELNIIQFSLNELNIIQFSLISTEYNPIQSQSTENNPVQSQSTEYNSVQSQSTEYNPIQSQSTENNPVQHLNSISTQFKFNILTVFQHILYDFHYLHSATPSTYFDTRTCCQLSDCVCTLTYTDHLNIHSHRIVNSWQYMLK